MRICRGVVDDGRCRPQSQEGAEREQEADGRRARSPNRRPHADETGESGQEADPCPAGGERAAEVGSEREETGCDGDQPHGLTKESPGVIGGTEPGGGTLTCCLL